MSFDFIEYARSKIESSGIVWEISGLIAKNNDVYTLGSDSKLIGRVFELLSAPLIKEIAKETGYKVEIPAAQNTYPDFTLLTSPEENNKIAIDIKTTYRRSKGKNGIEKGVGFTLGSYGSFIRNDTKNIHYNYSSYAKHYILGFLYDRNDAAIEGQVVKASESANIIPPYLNVEYFIQEKYRIAGDKPGSGNTENIGSFKTNNVELIKKGLGPFSSLGEGVFNHYWVNYPKYRESGGYKNLKEYFEWLEQEGHEFASKKSVYLEWLKKVEL
jgi:hypothetical protein